MDNVFTLQSLAMIKTHVLKIVVMLQLDADLYLNKSKILMHVPLELVMQ
jgi:hypothetical protein